MSKVEEAKSKCPCGAELKFNIQKPTHFTPTVSKITCGECQSRFLMHVEIKKSKPPFTREYIHRFELIRLSPEAAKRSSNPLRQVGSMIVEKVSKRDNGPEFKD